MITEVFINGQLIDINEDEIVTASYGNISFGEINKRKGVKTNRWKAPFSPRNKKIFENSELIGNNSELPYRRFDIEVKISGTTVFFGFAILDDSEGEYNIESYARASDFYTAINNKKLADLDTTLFNHNWNEVNVKNSLFNTQGYTYAFVYNGKTGQDGSVLENNSVETLLPNLFFHSVIKQIAADAGYTLTGDVLTNTRYLNHIIICNKFPLPFSFGDDVDISLTFPDLSQSKLWLDFANIYGIQFDIDQQNGVIRCDYIDGIIFNDPEDWSLKIDRTEKQTVSYSLEYGQKSYLRFNSDEICVEDYKKEILIYDQTLDLQTDIYKSSFFMVQPLGLYPTGSTHSFTLKDNQNFTGEWTVGVSYTPLMSVWWNGTYYLCILAPLGTTIGYAPPSPTYWKPVKDTDIWTVKSRAMYGYLATDPSSLVNVNFPSGVEQITRVVTNNNLDWTNSYNLHYRVFDRIKTKTKKVKLLVKLSYSDINQLDFTKAKKINNELFLLEDVTQFKLNKKDSTICNLIRL